jgi:formylmethanofuran dehydrogenase subunit C
MTMRKLSGCSYDTCPAIWEDGETVVVRGDLVDQVTVDREDGEAVVRLPASMFQEAASKLGR